MALDENHGMERAFCFNRKEIKDHGEGGNLVGAPLEGRVLIIDDVITAGTAIREAMDIIEANQAKAVGVAIALDRMEKGKGERSAIQEVETDYSLQVMNIADLEVLIEFIRQSGQYDQYLDSMLQYRTQYGINQ